MDKHAISATARRALAATGVGVVGLAVALPAQAALADDGDPSAPVTNNTLTVTGIDGGDTIHIGLGADPGTLLVDLGNGTLPQSFDRSTFTAISVFVLRGDDTVTAAAGSFSDEALTVSGGPGDDTITGSAGGDTLIGGPGDDTINGADGDDLVFGDGGADVVDGQRGTDSEFLGGGRDTAVWLPGEGSDAVDGGVGHDDLVFHGANVAERLALTANGSSDVL